MTDSTTWDRLHGEHLELLVASVRLRVERRARWLRAERWATDPLEELSATLVTDERADRLLAGDDRKQAAAFAAQDEASVRLSTMIDEVAAERSALAARLAEEGAPPRIDRLTADADLTPVERDGVVVALAAALDPGIGALLGYLQDDPALAHATPAVVAALFDHPRHHAWQLVAPSGSLRAAGLTVADPAQPSRIELAPRTLAWLAGDDRPDAGLHTVLRPAPPALLADTHVPIASRVSTALADGVDAVQLIGGGGPVAAAVAEARGQALLTVDAAALVAHPGRQQLLDALVREALLTPALVLVEVDGPLGDHEHELARLVDATPTAVVVATPSRLTTHGDVLVEELPPLTAGDRAALWQAAAGAAAPTGEALTALVDTFRMDPAGIAAAATEARHRDPAPDDGPGGHGATPADGSHGAHWAAARATVGRAVGGLAERIVPARDPADLVLPDPALAALDELVAQTRHQRRVFDEWGLRRLVPHGHGVTALFAGPSGTGKTMAAEVIAGRLGLDLYRVDLSAVVSKFIGETEKNLRRVFDAVESGAAVLLFDEADALFGRRTEVSDAHDRYANVEVSYLLQRMEQYAGIAVLTTNRKADIDEAFLRRLRFVVAFPFPDRTARRRIWERMLATDAPRAALDLDALTRLEITGGNIRNIVISAAFAAAEADAPVRMEHLMAAARREYGKLDRVVTPSEFGAWAVAS